MSIKGLFVTGTDTEIGKTITSTILTLGLNGSYWKPIQSGLEEETDSEFISQFIDKDRVLPEAYSLNKPLSPHLSAKIDNINIDFDSIKLPSKIKGPLIVEGAGGIHVPLNDKYFIIDIIKKFGLPTVITARSGLGTINHTLLTLEALRKRDISVLGVVMVGTKNFPNKEAIEKYGETSVLMEVEPIDKFTIENFKAIYDNSELAKKLLY